MGLRPKKRAIGGEADSPFLRQILATVPPPGCNIAPTVVHDAVAGVKDGGSLAGKDASDISSTLVQFLPG